MGFAAVGRVGRVGFRLVIAGLLLLTGLFGLAVNDYGAAGWGFAALCAVIAASATLVRPPR